MASLAKKIDGLVERAEGRKLGLLYGDLVDICSQVHGAGQGTMCLGIWTADLAAIRNAVILVDFEVC